MSTVTVDTRVTVTPQALTVAETGEESVLVQLWVRSSEGSWSGCLSSEAADELARRLHEAAGEAAQRNAA